MHIDKSKKFELNSPIFSQMRDDLDLYIRQCIVEMQKRDIASGAITLKIDITTMRETVADNNSPTGERNTIIPIIDYKLALNMQTKAEHKGKITDCGHEIVQDDTGAYFILTREKASGQLTTFNSYDEIDTEGLK